MMISYSTAAYMVDWLQSRADDPPTETEIESGGLLTHHTDESAVSRPTLASWLQRLGRKTTGLPTALAAGGNVR